MRLYFLRHGIATAPPGWDFARDDDRPLTSDGVIKMEEEARVFKRFDLGLGVIVTSPLARAKQTAKIVARRLDVSLVEDDLLRPGFSASAAARIVARYPGAEGLMFVGHEPDFSATVSALIGGGELSLKRGGLAHVEAEWTRRPSAQGQGGALRGTLVWLLAPRTILRSG
jgi:phosphohistidine phosphatase